MEGWIKLHRKIIDSKFGRNAEMLGFFSYLLMMANHKEGFTADGTRIGPGQFMTSQIGLSEHFNLNRAKVQRMLKKLSDAKQIEQRSNFQNTVITIVNWSEYQDSEQRPSSARAASEQRVSTNKNAKNVKNEKNNTFTEIGLYEVPQPSLEEAEDSTAPAVKILNAFNLICGKGLRPTPGNLKPINARLKEGYKYEEFIEVIKHFQKIWRNDPRFAQHLHPMTIFNGKFDSRLEQSRVANIERLDPLDVLFGNVVFPEVSYDA